MLVVVVAGSWLMSVRLIGEWLLGNVADVVIPTESVSCDWLTLMELWFRLLYNLLP